WGAGTVRAALGRSVISGPRFGRALAGLRSVQFGGGARGGQHGAVRDERGDLGDLRGEVAVGAGAGDLGAQQVAHGAGGRRGRQRGAQVQGAGGGEQLDGEDVGEGRHRPAQLARGRPAHRDVVLLHGG